MEDPVGVDGERHADPVVVPVDPVAAALADADETAPLQGRDQP